MIHKVISSSNVNFFFFVVIVKDLWVLTLDLLQLAFLEHNRLLLL
jgi:hypothetical protein